MTVACNTWDEWHEAVDVVTATVNRLANKSGFSPMQRMLGYNPRIPGSLMSGGFNDLSTTSRYEAGDAQVQRSVQLRTAAAIAYHKADCEQALRNSLHAGPRAWHHYEVGQTVYYWKKGMERGKKDHPYFWHGPAKVILTNLPTTVWVAHRGRIIKACPEHLRPIADEEKFILTDWIQDILETKNQLKEQDYKGYIVLDEKPPDALDYQPEIDKDFIGPLPPQAPRFRLTGKHHPDDVDFKPDPYDEKRRRLTPAEDMPDLVEIPPRSPSMAPTTPARTEDLEPNDRMDDLPPENDDQVPVTPDEPTDEAGQSPDGQHEPENDETDPRGQVRAHEPQGDEDRPTKRHRTELLEILYTQLENVLLARKRKETTYRNLDKKNQQKFDKAILKEIKNNMTSGAYKALSREESERIRREKPDLIMKSRYVLTEKQVEPHEVEPLRAEGLLLDNKDGDVLKAKARHVMKGYSENNAEDLESTTPQVAKDTVFFVLQILASMAWIVGHLDFTQAFHSGDAIERELYCSLPPEGVPGLHDRQLLRLLKTCYGLTDGPYQWYRHVSRVLASRGYEKSKADPCLFLLYNKDHTQIDGIIALATDDMIHGGNEKHWENMEWLKQQYKMGKYTTGSGKFTGKMIVPQDDGSILVHQQPYIEEKVQLIDIEKSRKRRRYSQCTPAEINHLRALLGSLSWVAKESRPDIAGRVALLQHSMPYPLVKDMVEANQIAEELKKNPSLGIRVQPIPLSRLRVGVITDASWGNSGDLHTEESKKDYWEETSTSWIRHHILPRRLLFHPGAAPGGPDLHSISRTRTTRTTEEIVTDQWDDKDGIREHDGSTWTGTTIFLKTEIETEINKPINERFLQLARKHSQGGYLLVYFDSNLEVSEQLEMMTIASWKSYKLKRCTVNTLSAECQSMIQGVGNLHWHRFLMTEIMGSQHQLDTWETELSKIPFIAVTDSKSLYDTVTKCRNTSAHVDDKRTAIDLTILKDDLERTRGQVRWVSGTNMVSDPLTKKMPPGFLQKVMKLGRWSLTEKGHHKLLEINALVNIKCGACEN
eukprot:s2710_g8.t1